MITAEPRHKAAIVAAIATVAAGFLAMAFHYFAGAEGDPEGVWSAIGFGAPFVGIGGLASIGLKFGKPVLCGFAGLSLIPMSIVSIVLLPLLIAATILMSVPAESPGPKGSFVPPAMFAVVPLISFAILVFHRDPVTWTTPDGDSGGSSDIVTSLEASISVFGILLALVAALLWATSKAPDRSRLEQTV